MDTDDPHPVYWSTAVAGPSTFGRLTPELVLIGLGLAILLPVVPFTLEFLALRRLTTAAFGTLMSLEPAFALLIGFIVLNQHSDALAILGIACVVVAGIGAQRTGGRELVPAPAWPARVGLRVGFAWRFSNADRDQASDHSRPRSA